MAPRLRSTVRRATCSPPRWSPLRRRRASSSPPSPRSTPNPKDTKDHPFGVWTLPPTRQSSGKPDAPAGTDAEVRSRQIRRHRRERPDDPALRQAEGPDPRRMTEGFGIAWSRRRWLAGGGALAMAGALSACGRKAAAPAVQATAPGAAPRVDPNYPDTLEAAVAGPWRTAADKRRDVWRHPAETLSFFDVKPGATVVELWPGSGWYTQHPGTLPGGHGGQALRRPAADAVGGRSGLRPGGGRLSHPLHRQARALRQARDHPLRPDVWAALPGGDGGRGAVPAQLPQLDGRRLGRKGAEGCARRPEAPAAFWAWRSIARQTAGRWIPWLPPATSTSATSCRWRRRPGSSSRPSSEINANPKDDHDHPFGVWTLPPTRRSSPRGQAPNPKFDQRPYDAIGESDRMTLRFRKPA